MGLAQAHPNYMESIAANSQYIAKTGHSEHVIVPFYKNLAIIEYHVHFETKFAAAVEAFNCHIK